MVQVENLLLQQMPVWHWCRGVVQVENLLLHHLPVCCICKSDAGVTGVMYGSVTQSGTSVVCVGVTQVPLSIMGQSGTGIIGAGQIEHFPFSLCVIWHWCFVDLSVAVLQIHWEVRGSSANVTDVRPKNGTLILEDGQRQGQITLQILPDDVPELTEEFSLVMTFVEGGAELNPQGSQAVFRIR